MTQLQLKNSMTEEYPIFRAVTERDVDLLLLQEFHGSDVFVTWFVGQVWPDFKTIAFVNACHSVTHAQLGESDLLLLFTDNSYHIYALLIENKIDASPQPEQAKRYTLRGNVGIDDKHWWDFRSVLVTPQNYLEQETNMSGYNRTLSYESVRDWFISQNNKRATYAAKLIQEAIEQNRRGYTQVVDEQVTKFWKNYYILATAEFPELAMRRPRGIPLGSDWIQFRPKALPKRCLIRHKLTRGYIDLELAGLGHRVERLIELNKNSLEPDEEIVVTGKSASFRLTVTSINKLHSFEEQREKVYEGLRAAKRLLELSKHIQGLDK